MIEKRARALAIGELHSAGVSEKRMPEHWKVPRQVFIDANCTEESDETELAGTSLRKNVNLDCGETDWDGNGGVSGRGGR